jgi:cell division protein FtsX
MRDEKQGCLGGLLQLFLVKKVYDWAQQKFGYGNGIFGCGCGCLLTIIFIIIVISVLTNTNFLDISF